MKVTEQTNMLDILRLPEARKVLDRHGLSCRGCMGAAAETLLRAAESHGVDPSLLVREVNEALRGHAPSAKRVRSGR